ncbi:MAG: hypothetical protein WCW04_03245 [Candidatus Paceibacterota bacterium]
MESKPTVVGNIKKINNNDSSIIDTAVKMFAEIIIFSLEDKESSREDDSIYEKS